MYPIKSKPLNRSWKEWATMWWKWCSAEPDETNPAADKSGIHCGRNQRDQFVWFLAGTYGGAAIRHCCIPTGRSILFPIITDRISFAEHEFLKTEKELSSYAKADMDHTSTLKVNIDGVKLPNFYYNRVRTDLFNFNMISNESWKYSRRTCRAISDGYWVFLHPLPAGKHTIDFIGEKLRFDDYYLSNFKGKKQKFSVKMKYYLAVG